MRPRSRPRGRGRARPGSPRPRPPRAGPAPPRSTCPAMLRTMWRRKLRPSATSVTSSRARLEREPVQAAPRFSSSGTPPGAPRNALKSCVPSSAFAPSAIAATSSGARRCRLSARAQRARLGAVQDPVRVELRDARRGARRSRGASASASTATSRGSTAFSARCRSPGASRVSRVEVRDLPARVHARVGAPGRVDAPLLARDLARSPPRARPARCARWAGAGSPRSRCRRTRA